MERIISFDAVLDINEANIGSGFFNLLTAGNNIRKTPRYNAIEFNVVLNMLKFPPVFYDEQRQRFVTENIPKV